MDENQNPIPGPPYEFEQMKNALKEKGVEDPEISECLIMWTRKQEEKVTDGATHEVQILAQIEFERLRAKLFYESEYHEEGHASWQDARTIAVQQGLPTVLAQIEEEIDNLK